MQHQKLRWLLLVAILLLGAAFGVRQYQENLSRSFPQMVNDPQIHELSERATLQKAAVERNPNDVVQRWLLADSYQKLGSIPLAREQIEAITKIKPDSVEAWLALARINLGYREWTEAERNYRAALEASPRSGSALSGLAVALFHQGRFSEAIEPAKKSVHLYPIEPNYRFTLANCYLENASAYPNPSLHAEQLESAVYHFSKTLINWADNGQIYYRLGRAYGGLKENSLAIKNLRRAVELLPDNVDAGLLLANHYKDSNNDIKAAQELTDRLLIKHPNNAAIHSVKADLLTFSKTPNATELVLSARQKVVALAPRVHQYQQQLGTAYLQAGHPKEAEAAFTRAIELNPNDPFSYQQLSSICRRRGQNKEADSYAAIAEKMVFNREQLRQFEQTGQVLPGDARLRLVLAERYRELNRLPAARSEYLAVLKLQPRNKRALAGLALIERSVSQNTSLNSVVPFS